MITVNDVELRNLQEQVEKNKSDIDYLYNEHESLNQFGIKLVGIVEDSEDLPTVDDYKEEHEDWGYGDTIAIGTEENPPYSLRVLTRAGINHPVDYWFNLGDFPLAGPEGPVGPRGLTGNNGANGVGIQSITKDIKSGRTQYYKIHFTNGTTTSFSVDDGEQGIQGVPGIQGPPGTPATAIKLVGTLTSTSQLPTPSPAIRSDAYLIEDSLDETYHLWALVGPDSPLEDLLWTDLGDITVDVQNKSAIYDNGVFKDSYDVGSLVTSVNGKSGKTVVLDATDLILTTNQQTVQANFIRVDSDIGMRPIVTGNPTYTPGTEVTLDAIQIGTTVYKIPSTGGYTHSIDVYIHDEMEGQYYHFTTEITSGDSTPANSFEDLAYLVGGSSSLAGPIDGEVYDASATLTIRVNDQEFDIYGENVPFGGTKPFEFGVVTDTVS